MHQRPLPRRNAVLAPMGEAARLVKAAVEISRNFRRVVSVLLPESAGTTYLRPSDGGADGREKMFAGSASLGSGRAFSAAATAAAFVLAKHESRRSSDTLSFVCRRKDPQGLSRHFLHRIRRSIVRGLRAPDHRCISQLKAATSPPASGAVFRRVLVGDRDVEHRTRMGMPGFAFGTDPRPEVHAPWLILVPVAVIELGHRPDLSL